MKPGISGFLHISDPFNHCQRRWVKKRKLKEVLYKALTQGHLVSGWLICRGGVHWWRTHVWESQVAGDGTQSLYGHKPSLSGPSPQGLWPPLTLKYNTGAWRRGHYAKEANINRKSSGQDGLSACITNPLHRRSSTQNSGQFVDNLHLGETQKIPEH